ncbi:MAG TPA: S1/P1 nuclease, partial [Gemmatirosa sp.]|nr:S1/P1 nuclease [Gemmatirosa sp.]
WRAMSPATRARAVALLRAAPRDAGLAELRPSAGGPEARDRALFARAAAWPDYVKSRRDSLLAARSRRYNHPTWHYLNQYWQPGAGGWPQVVTGPGLRTEPEDVVERIRRFSATVGDARRPAAERAVELAWLLHLVGDLHQPLHAASRVDAANPTGDRGGNRVRLGSTNLHAFWDDALDTGRPRRGRGNAPGPEARTAQAERVAAALARRTPVDVVRASLAVTDPAVWAGEGLALAARAVYPGVTDGARIPEGYRARARQTAEPQAALAGYRLAALLERALGR